jgi:hypothetical protein
MMHWHADEDERVVVFGATLRPKLVREGQPWQKEQMRDGQTSAFSSTRRTGSSQD